MTDDVEAERAAIVAWLRDEFAHEYTCDQIDAYMVADAIERGDHHPRKETGSE